MCKFAMSAALVLASFVGMTSVAKSAEVAQPVGTTELGQHEASLVYGPYLFEIDAQVKAAQLRNLGFFTQVWLATDGYFYVEAW